MLIKCSGFVLFSAKNYESLILKLEADRNVHSEGVSTLIVETQPENLLDVYNYICCINLIVLM